MKVTWPILFLAATALIVCGSMSFPQNVLPILKRGKTNDDLADILRPWTNPVYDT